MAREAARTGTGPTTLVAVEHKRRRVVAREFALTQPFSPFNWQLQHSCHEWPARRCRLPGVLRLNIEIAVAVHALDETRERVDIAR